MCQVQRMQKWIVLMALAAVGAWAVPAGADDAAPGGDKPAAKPAADKPAKDRSADADLPVKPKAKDEPKPGKTDRSDKGPKGQKAESDVSDEPAWMGVHLSPVPAAVAAHLGLKDRGVMVRNVVKASPADKAGLQRHDVIVELDGKNVSDDVEKFANRIKAMRPGQAARLTVMHEGQKKDLEVVLAKPIPADQVKYIYEDDADETVQDAFRLHRGLLRKGDGGVVIIGPGGEFKLPIDVEVELNKLLPKKGVSSDVQVQVGGSGKVSFSVSRSVDGKSVMLKSTPDGGIVVDRKTRTDTGEQTSHQEYKSADELRQKDPEAYELYKGVAVGGGHVTVRTLTGEGWPTIRLRPDQPFKDLEKRLKELAEEARSKAAATRVEIAKAIAGPEPAREFNVDKDGRIEVRVRQGDSAGTFSFKDEAEMKDKAPELHKHYRRLLGGGKD